jgi:Na+/melibiose symporter-like transporter
VAHHDGDLTMVDIKFGKLPDRTPVKVVINTTPDLQGALNDYLRLAKRADVKIILLGELLLGLAAGTTTTRAVFFFSLAKGIAAADVGLILIGQFAVALVVTPVWTRLAGRRPCTCGDRPA